MAALLTFGRRTTDPSAPDADTGVLYLKGATDAAIKAYFEKPSGAVLELANTTDANSWAGAQTFNAGASIPTGFNLTGAGTAQVTGFATVAATTGTFTNVGGTLSTAAQNSVTTMTGLTTVGALNTGSITSGFGSIDVGADAISGGIGTFTKASAGNIGIFTDGTKTLYIKSGSGFIGIFDSVDTSGSGIYFDSTNSHFFGAGANIINIVNATGAVAIPYVWANTGGTTAVMVDSAGTLFKLASARKYKEDFADYTKGLETVLALSAAGKYYRPKHAHGTGYLQAGYVAEDLHDMGLQEFVAYGPMGEPDSVNYGHMGPLYANAITQLAQIIRELAPQKFDEIVSRLAKPSLQEINSKHADYVSAEVARDKIKKDAEVATASRKAAAEERLSRIFH